MCWSFESSLYMGVFAITIGFYCTLRKKSKRDLFFGPFLMLYSLMQIVDAILWYDENTNGLCNNSRVNYYATRYGVNVVLYLQPFALVLLTQIAKLKCPRPIPFKIAYVFYGLYGILSMLGYTGFTPIYSTLSSSGKHILWGGAEIPIVQLIVFMLVIGWPYTLWEPLVAGILQLVLFFAIFVYARLGTDAFGSNWCFLATFDAVLMLFDPWIFGVDKQEQEKANEKSKTEKEAKKEPVVESIAAEEPVLDDLDTPRTRMRTRRARRA